MSSYYRLNAGLFPQTILRSIGLHFITALRRPRVTQRRYLPLHPALDLRRRWDGFFQGAAAKPFAEPFTQLKFTHPDEIRHAFAADAVVRGMRQAVLPTKDLVSRDHSGHALRAGQRRRRSSIAFA